MFSTFLLLQEYGVVASNKIEDGAAIYCYYSERRTETWLAK